MIQGTKKVGLDRGEWVTIMYMLDIPHKQKREINAKKEENLTHHNSMHCAVCNYLENFNLRR